MTETKRKGLGGFDKVLIGCGIGCAALILFTILGVAFGTMWVFTPGRQAATERIVDDASLGVVRLHELADDPGTQELFTRVLESLDEANRKQQREQLPDGLRWISDLQAKQSNPSGLNMMIPKEMTIAFEESPDGESVDYVVAFNPRAMVRMIKMMLGLVGRANEGDVRSDYAGHPVYRFEEDAHLAFVRSTVLYSNSASALERAIDRLEAGDGDDAPARRRGELTTRVPEGDWDVEGTVGNEAGLVDAFLAAGREDDPEVEDASGEETTGQETAGQETLESIAGEDVRMGFGFDIVSADELTGLTVFECGDRRVAERLEAELARQVAESMEEAAARGLELEVTSRVEGERVVVDIRLVGLGQVIADALVFDEDFDDEDFDDEAEPETIEE